MRLSSELILNSKANKILFKFLVICTCLSLNLNINVANAALTATTAKTIQGHGPRFITSIESGINNKSDFNYFGVKYNGTDYYVEKDLQQAVANNIIAISATPSDLSFASVLNTNVTPSDINDQDGDAFVTAPLTEDTSNSISVEWYYLDGGGSEVALSNSSNLLNTNFCALSDSGIEPYIKVSGGVILETEYGDPNTQNYPDSSLSLETPQRKFKPVDGGYCFFKTADLKVINNGTVDLFDSAEWNNDKKAFYANTYFPSTGFEHAKFDLLMLGSDYTFSVTDNGVSSPSPSSVTVNSSTGEVTFNSKPNGELAFIATKNEVEYKILQTINNWGTPRGLHRFKSEFNWNIYDGVYEAANACAGNAPTDEMTYDDANSYFFERKQLTNAFPQAYTVLSTYSKLEDVPKNGYFSRKVGTFMGEWGFLPTYNSSLKSSGDNLTQRYWTSEAMVIAALTQQNQAAV